MRVWLPGGQELCVVMIGRRRDPDGTWWCDVALAVWSRVDLPTGQAGVEPFAVTFPMPMDRVEPVPGQDYSAVPSVDLTVRRPWSIVWTVPPPIDGPRGTLHRVDCHQARAGEPLTDDEARIDIGDGGLALCTVCRPNTAPAWRTLRR